MSDLLRSSQRNNLKLEDFQIQGVLGEGSFGFILLAARNQEEYALKEMSKYRLKKIHKEHIALIQKELLKMIDHPGIIKAHGAFQTASKLYLVIQPCKGGQFQYYVRRGMSQKAKRFYFAQLVNTLEYLHSIGVVHRDLKPSNLLFSQEGHLKVIDFGTACVENCTIVSQAFKDSLQSIKQDKQHIEDQLGDGPNIRKRKSTFVGTSEYMSPQLLQRNQCDATSDLWALGCILYFIYYGYGPFFDPCELLLYKKIRCGKVDFPQNEHSSAQVENLISKLLVLTPQNRLGSGTRQQLTFKALKSHPFFKDIDVDRVFQSQPPDFINPEVQIETQLNNITKKQPSESQYCNLILYLAKRKHNIYVIYRCEFYADLIMREFQLHDLCKEPVVYKLRKQQNQCFARQINNGKIQITIEFQQDQTSIFYRTHNSSETCQKINEMHFQIKNEGTQKDEEKSTQTSLE